MTLCFCVIFIILLCLGPKEFVFLVKFVVEKQKVGNGRKPLHQGDKKQIKDPLLTMILCGAKFDFHIKHEASSYASIKKR